MSNADKERKAEAAWCNTVNDQGWNEKSQIILLEGFIRQKGLFAEFAAYAKEVAKEENAST